MVRSGGLCVVEPPGSNLIGVSPRIRALQDRLLDSLPADGAWECLSPAQREAIISLHRGRITRNLVEKSPEKQRKGQSGLNRYGRSRSYEDKLESETDDSGVRLMSGETNSSSTSNSHDDSSDPGVKRGRFAKSPRADRQTRKEAKAAPYDAKRKVVGNGVGNVNKIISKQLHRGGTQHPSNVTLDCRNIDTDYRRSRILRNNFIDPKRPSDPYQRRRTPEGEETRPVKTDRISRKNILQRYQNSLPKIASSKETTSSEECDSGVNLQSFEGLPRPHNGVDVDSDRFMRSESPPTPPRGYSMEESRMFRRRPTDRLLDEDFSRGHLSLDSSHLTKKHHHHREEKINTSFDYRTELNHDKYSKNWRSVVVKRDLTRAQEVPPSAAKHTEERKAPFSPERNQSRKYIRSKSLDRKYLDDSTDDESDFEVRRRTERMRRYTKAKEDWEASRPEPPHRYRPKETKPKAKSAWDISAQAQHSAAHNFGGGDVFLSRTKILNKWKSEDVDLTLGVEDDVREEELERSRWRRRSCDFELDASDGEAKRKKQWQRRSCDFELDFDRDEWEESVDREMRLVRQRNRVSPRQGMHPPKKAPPPKDLYPRNVPNVDASTLPMPPNRRPKQSSENFRAEMKPEICGRKWVRPEEPKYPPVPKEKSKSPWENGVLSFENPNYTLGKNIDENSNTSTTSNNTTGTEEVTSNELPLDGGLAALDSLYSELDQVCNLSRTSSVRNRRHYANLDVNSMGVDVNTGPLTNLDQSDHQNNSLVENECMMGRKKGNFATQPDLIATHSQPPPNQIINNLQDHQTSNHNDKDPDKAMVTPEEGSDNANSCSPKEGASTPTDIPHMTPFDSQDLYALPLKKPQTEEEDDDEKKDPPGDEALPVGWEKHEDNDGPYFWHIKSGTITREPPTTSTQVQSHAPLRAERRYKDDQMSSSMSGSVTRSNTSSALSELVEGPRPRSSAAVDNAYKRRSYPARSDLSDSCGGRPIRFAVRSLGWVEIAEEDLTPERSSKAVNRCIVDLSVGGRRDLLDVVGRWGDGKDLFMDLDEGSLKLVDPENLTLLNTQPIHTIRVWGVGRDNGRERDFAYVARDRVTRKHMCHVFRCDTPARTIANTLRDICKKIMIERSLQQTMLAKPESGQMLGNGLGGRVARPTNLPTENRRFQRHSQILIPQSFPTPMEEPKKVLKGEYLGSVQVRKNNIGVSKPSGMEVLNAAIDTLNHSSNPRKNVSVAVAPSTITITNNDDGLQLAECRVRFLSFLGIGINVKFCAFIMHTAQDQYIAHVFHCEPSSGALCKTIEAACKLRYQKCLDAHPGGRPRTGDTTPKSLSAALRSVFTSFAGKKAKSAES